MTKSDKNTSEIKEETSLRFHRIHFNDLRILGSYISGKAMVGGNLASPDRILAALAERIRSGSQREKRIEQTSPITQIDRSKDATGGSWPYY